MKLLLITHSSDQYHNADMDYAIVDLTHDCYARILKYCELADELKRKDHNFSSVLFDDASPTYVEWCEEIDEITRGKGICDGIWIIDRDIPEENYRRTEYDCLVVTYSGSVFWRSGPWRSDCEVETAYLDLAFLQKIIAASAL